MPKRSWSPEHQAIGILILHAAGIRNFEDKLAHNNGKTLKKFGPPEKERLLHAIKFPSGKIKAIKTVIGNHHTPLSNPSSVQSILRWTDRVGNRDERV